MEEIGAALKAAGADDGLILDNGGSVVCWVWWANLYSGGTVSTTVDYRADATSAIAFLLKGPLMTDLPGGSVSYSAIGPRLAARGWLANERATALTRTGCRRISKQR